MIATSFGMPLLLGKIILVSKQKLKGYEEKTSLTIAC